MVKESFELQRSTINQLKTLYHPFPANVIKNYFYPLAFLFDHPTSKKFISFFKVKFQLKSHFIWEGWHLISKASSSFHFKPI